MSQLPPVPLAPPPRVSGRFAPRPSLHLPSGRALRWLALAAAFVLGWGFDLHARLAVPVLVRVMAVDDRDTIQYARRGIGFLGGAAVPSLLGAIDRADGDLRQRLYIALGDLEAPAAADALVAALEDPDPVVRFHAMRGLAAIPHPDAVSLSLRVLQDPDPHVRAAAVPVLTRAHHPEYIFPLTRAYVGADADLRDAITQSLQIYGVAALPHLDTVWNRLNQNGRRAVVACVEGIGGPEATALLITTLQEEPRSAVRFFIGEALERTTGESLGDNADAWSAWQARQGTARS